MMIDIATAKIRQLLGSKLSLILSFVILFIVITAWIRSQFLQSIEILEKKNSILAENTKNLNATIDSLSEQLKLNVNKPATIETVFVPVPDKNSGTAPDVETKVAPLKPIASVNKTQETKTTREPKNAGLFEGHPNAVFCIESNDGVRNYVKTIYLLITQGVSKVSIDSRQHAVSLNGAVEQLVYFTQMCEFEITRIGSEFEIVFKLKGNDVEKKGKFNFNRTYGSEYDYELSVQDENGIYGSVKFENVNWPIRVR
jgi:hypothetical protein